MRRRGIYHDNLHRLPCNVTLHNLPPLGSERMGRPVILDLIGHLFNVLVPADLPDQLWHETAPPPS